RLQDKIGTLHASTSTNKRLAPIRRAKIDYGLHIKVRIIRHIDIEHRQDGGVSYCRRLGEQIGLGNRNDGDARKWGLVKSVEAPAKLPHVDIYALGVHSQHRKVGKVLVGRIRIDGKRFPTVQRVRRVGNRQQNSPLILVWLVHAIHGDRKPAPAQAIEYDSRISVVVRIEIRTTHGIAGIGVRKQYLQHRRVGQRAAKRKLNVALGVQ